MRFSANASPPGASGAAVLSVSVTGTDTAGVLKSLDAAARRTLGEALLTAASTAWPNASVSLLVTDPSSDQSLIGTRPVGGPNIVVAS